MLSNRIDWPALNAWLKRQHGNDSGCKGLETRVVITRDVSLARVIVRDARAGTEWVLLLTETELRLIGALREAA